MVSIAGYRIMLTLSRRFSTSNRSCSWSSSSSARALTFEPSPRASSIAIVKGESAKTGRF